MSEEGLIEKVVRTAVRTYDAIDHLRKVMGRDLGAVLKSYDIQEIKADIDYVEVYLPEVGEDLKVALEGLLKAIEWRHSGDWTKDTILKALKEVELLVD